MIICLLIIPLIGVLLLLPLGKDSSLNNLSVGVLQKEQILGSNSTEKSLARRIQLIFKNSDQMLKKSEKELMKKIALFVSLLNLLLSIYMWFQFDYNTTSYQFVSEFNQLSFCHFHVGVDGISLYFVLLTTFITPICILSN